jgi:membrane-associated HD superfamily phosphohydrolase
MGWIWLSISTIFRFPKKQKNELHEILIQCNILFVYIICCKSEVISRLYCNLLLIPISYSLFVDQIIILFVADKRCHLISFSYWATGTLHSSNEACLCFRFASLQVCLTFFGWSPMIVVFVIIVENFVTYAFVPYISP